MTIFDSAVKDREKGDDYSDHIDNVFDHDENVSDCDDNVSDCDKIMFLMRKNNVSDEEK